MPFEIVIVGLLLLVVGLVSVQFVRSRSATPSVDKLTEELKGRIESLIQEVQSLRLQSFESSRLMTVKEVIITELKKDLEQADERYRTSIVQLSAANVQKEELEKTRQSLMNSENEAAAQRLKIADLQEILDSGKTEITQLKMQVTALNDDKNSLIADNARYRFERDAQKQKHEELATAFEEQKKSLREEISNTMQKLLESKIEKFDETSIKALDGLLKPFRENIDGFRKKVEESQKENGERIAALSKEIEQVMKAGLSITAEAQNLTKALKGEKQAQGRWGEMVLESVLEHSGLIHGEHYRTQESFRDDDGNSKRPDVIVKLPQNRSIIIDSKVSLVDYDSYIRAETDEAHGIAAAGIARAFRNHIDTLQSKDYAHYEAGTLQYVFMFVPVEGAYAVAVHRDSGLYEYALKKNIVIVYPSTLVVTLKTIYMYWQRESSDQAVENIYLEAGKLYDKVYVFVETFERVGRQIETVSQSYQTAATQLYTGTGNLVKRAETLKALGAKATKNIKMLKVKNSDFGDDDMEVVVVPEKETIEEEVMLENK